MQKNKPQSAPPKNTSSNNEYLGFLNGHENGKQSAQRNQRRQQFRKANPIPPLNTGMSGTMITSPDKPSITVQPTNITQNIALPVDIQEKINRWRENRTKQDLSSTRSSVRSSNSSSSMPIQVTQVRGRLSPQQQQPKSSPPAFYANGIDDIKTLITKEENKNEDEVPTDVPQTNSIQVQLKGISLFDPQQQEILRGQVDFEVKRVLDQLKKERPELSNQADIMNAVAQKTRSFEESLQQFNIREQRLLDMIDQMNVKIKAVQSNVDNTKSENGGQFITENVMKSWVSFFLSEQMANVKTGDIRKNTAERLGIKESSTVMESLDFLGFFSDEPLNYTETSPFEITSDRMIDRMMLSEHERDVVLLQHIILASYPDGRREVIKSSMVDYGSPSSNTAIARTVALPAAIAAKLLLENKIMLSGVYRPVVPQIYIPVLNELKSLGIEMNEEYGLAESEMIS